MKDILSRLKEEILIYDGAMGTLLQEAGALKAGACPEELNLSRPDAVKSVHSDYVKAGADVIETNSFGANRLKLGAYGLGRQVYRINYEAARIARRAASGRAYVAGSVGPLDRQIRPLGELSFDDALDVFREQIKPLKDGGCDLIILETFADIKELKAAFIAAREIGGLAVQAQMTFEAGERTIYGTPPSAFAVLFQSLGADIIGANCSTGPRELLKVIKEVAPLTDRFISCLPNAGLPELRGDKTYFPEGPKSFARYALEFARSGVNLVGGCCGTTPEHIKEIKSLLKNRKPAKRRYLAAFRLSSRSNVVELHVKTMPLIIGERINPTGKKDLQNEIRRGKTAVLRREALEQTKKGADILDVNVGVPGCDEPRAMSRAIEAVQGVCGVPLSIDSSNPKAIEAALKAVDGKPIINSVNGEREKINSILPLARKHGAAILVLTLDKRGLPRDAKARLKIAAVVIKKALEAGIPKEDIAVDPLTLTASANPQQVRQSLLAIKRLKALGYPTSLGISNISFGLPQRSRINADFFSLALAFGLDMAILNPADGAVLKAAKSKKKRRASEAGVKKFLEGALRPVKGIAKGRLKLQLARRKDIRVRLKEAILYGDKDNIVSLTEEALSEGIAPLEISNSILRPALEEVGAKFAKRQYFLPQVMLSAEAMQRAFRRLKAQLKPGEGGRKGRLVIATVEGDIHDIGKNIVVSVLENHGYEVFDLGRSVPAGVIIKEAVKRKADIIGLSALMTTTMVEMEAVVKEIKRRRLNFKTIVGGAVVTKDFARRIGACAYARDAVEAAGVVKALMKKRFRRH